MMELKWITDVLQDIIVCADKNGLPNSVAALSEALKITDKEIGMELMACAPGKALK